MKTLPLSQSAIRKMGATLGVLVLAVAAIDAQKSGTADAAKAIREADEQWSAAAVSKDAEKTASFYSDDALILPANEKAVSGKAAGAELWKGLFANGSISWKTAKVEAASSGEMGYSSGTYELTMNDSSGKPLTDKGKYLEIWKKQADGKWKCTVDIWNSDLPAAPPEKK